MVYWLTIAFFKIKSIKTTMTESLLQDTSLKLEWIHKITVDDKKRIKIPNTWLALLKPWMSIQIMNAWAYFILTSETKIDEPDIIVVSHKISHDGRLLLGEKLRKFFDIELWKSVVLIGKWNHIELYTNMDNFENALRRSQNAVRNFQARLLWII